MTCDGSSMGERSSRGARRLSERLIRWCRRNPWVAASIVTLVVGIVVSGWQAVRAIKAESEARGQRDRAEFEAANASSLNEFLTKDLLGHASVYNQARPDPDLKVRTVLDAAAAIVNARFAKRPLLRASIQLTIGETYQQLGLYPVASRQLEAAWDLRRRGLGDDHPDTLNAQAALGSLDLADGKLKEAETLLLGARKGLERARGFEHLDTYEAYYLVGQLYYLQGKYADSEPMLERVYAAFRKAKGDADPKTLGVLNDLAMAYTERKKFPEAVELLEGVVKSMTRIGRDEHPDTLLAKTNLARFYGYLKRPTEKQQILEDVLKVQRRILGNTHADTVRTLHDLGEFYKYEGQLDKAEGLLIEAAKGARAVLDPNHELLSAVLSQLYHVYRLKGDEKKMGPVLREAREIWHARHGVDGITVGMDRAVGMYHLKRKDPAKAEPYFREERDFRTTAEPDHWNRFMAEARLGASLLGQRKYREAESCLLLAYRGLKEREPGISVEQQAEMRWTIEQIIILTEEAGPLEHRADLERILADPGVKRIYGDLRFPADPFAPP